MPVYKNENRADKLPILSYGGHGDSKLNSSLLFDNLIWLTTIETAIYLRRFTKDGLPSDGAIRTLVCRGKLRARKFLGKLYFKRSELDRLIETSEIIGGRIWQ